MVSEIEVRGCALSETRQGEDKVEQSKKNTKTHKKQKNKMQHHQTRDVRLLNGPYMARFASVAGTVFALKGEGCG